jgi:hypothetical protein
MYMELLRGEPSDRRYNTMRRKIAAPILPPTIAAVLGADAVKKKMKSREWLVR